MTDAAEEPARQVTSAAELLQDVTVDLLGITFYKVGAELNTEHDVDDSELGDLEPKFGLKTFHQGREIGVRLALTLSGDKGVIEVDLAANYEAAVPVELPGSVLLDFANNVAVMALLPYVRESVWSLSQRVFGTPLVMPVYQRGQIAFDPASSEE